MLRQQTYTALGWATIALSVVSWILILLQSITSLDSNDMTLARVIVNDGDQDHVASFGIVGYYSDPEIRDQSPTSSRMFRSGYTGEIRLLRNETWGGERQTRMRDYQVVVSDETAELILFPISLGFLGGALFFFLVGFGKRSAGYGGFGILLSLVAMCLAWAGWSYARDLASKIDQRLEWYRETGVWDVRTETGNAIWPALAGNVILTVATLLMVVVMIIRPRNPSTGPETDQTEMTATAKSGNDTDGHSQTTVA